MLVESPTFFPPLFCFSLAIGITTIPIFFLESQGIFPIYVNVWLKMTLVNVSISIAV